jgi:dephospho-CoA kinase
LPWRKNKRTLVLIIGITGGLGTGKTTVAGELKKKGCAVLEADLLAKEARKKGTTTYERIVKEFGVEILGPGKNIDRKKLADKAFRNRAGINKLCGIIHPYVCYRIRKTIKDLKKRNFKKPVIIDAPLLIEAGLEKEIDVLIVVRSYVKNQIARSTKGLGITAEHARRRIKAQMPLSKKGKMADFIIDNNGTKAQLNKKVDRLWKELRGHKT